MIASEFAELFSSQNKNKFVKDFLKLAKKNPNAIVLYESMMAGGYYEIDYPTINIKDIKVRKFLKITNDKYTEMVPLDEINYGESIPVGTTVEEFDGILVATEL